jgi:hypothetical protein
MVRINFEVGGGTKHFLNERMLPKVQAQKAKPDKRTFFQQRPKVPLLFEFLLVIEPIFIGALLLNFY